MVFSRLLRRRARARNVSYTPYSTGDRHTISTFVDKTHIQRTCPRRKQFFSKLVFQCKIYTPNSRPKRIKTYNIPTFLMFLDYPPPPPPPSIPPLRKLDRKGSECTNLPLNHLRFLWRWGPLCNQGTVRQKTGCGTYASTTQTTWSAQSVRFRPRGLGTVAAGLPR